MPERYRTTSRELPNKSVSGDSSRWKVNHWRIGNNQTSSYSWEISKKWRSGFLLIKSVIKVSFCFAEIPLCWWVIPSLYWGEGTPTNVRVDKLIKGLYGDKARSVRDLGRTINNNDTILINFYLPIWIWWGTWRMWKVLGTLSVWVLMVGIKISKCSASLINIIRWHI